MKIQLNDALSMLHDIEVALVPVGYHVGLRGSVLLNGESENDLDIFIYPHDSTNIDPNARDSALKKLGMIRNRTVAGTWSHWRNKGSMDEKMLEIWDWDGIVVDILLM